MKAPICKPVFGPEEAAAVAAVLESGWVVQGPKVAEFERSFAAFVGGNPHAVATTSCTTALHAALLAFDVGPGDDVIVPSFTWVATANAVELTGARPVFVDVDRDTFNLDVNAAAAAFAKRTKAVMPVSLFGLPAPTLEIMRLATGRALVIEDCACALGAYVGVQHAGTVADAAAFSFHPRKAITTGEGGMLITSNAALAADVCAIRDHGAGASDLSRHLGPRAHVLPHFDRVGSNYRMTDIQGAIGIEQMKRLPGLLEARTMRAKRYEEMLGNPRSGVAYLRLPRAPVGTQHGWQSYVTWFCPEEPTMGNVGRLHARRNELMGRLAERGIATRPGTHAVHMLGYYAKKYDLKPEDFPNAYLADRLSLALPLYPTITDEEQDYVVDALRKFGPCQ